MHSARAILIGLSWLAADLPASAQTAPPSGAPPPVPEVTAPPPWAPYYIAPGPSPAQIDGLEQRGRRNKRTGAILMGTGGGIALIGTGLLIAGAESDSCDHHDDFFHHHHDCSDSALSLAGATTTLLGLAALIPGVVIYVDGGRDMAKARNLRRLYWGSASLRPTLGRNTVGLQLQMSH
jgi:hypothetical protein